jgi:hypothetical protein
MLYNEKESNLLLFFSFFRALRCCWVFGVVSLTVILQSGYDEVTVAGDHSYCQAAHRFALTSTKGEIVGGIHIPVGTPGDHHWSSYMGQKLDAIIADWVERVELGAITKWANGSYEPISTEHLRIAKAFLNRTPPAQVDVLAITDVQQEWSMDELPPMIPSMPTDIRRGRPVDQHVQDAMKEYEYAESFDRAEEDLGDSWKGNKEDREAVQNDRNSREAARKARIDAARQVLSDEGVDILERRNPLPGSKVDYRDTL